jgi:hypothetical protein
LELRPRIEKFYSIIDGKTKDVWMERG